MIGISSLSPDDPQAKGQDVTRDTLPKTIIGPAQGWIRLMPSNLWAFRDLLVALAWRHIQVRYKQAALGGLWAILQPVAAAAAFTLVFRGMVGSTGETPYLVFAFSGILLWQLLASIVGAGSMSLVDNAPLITKVYFPRLLVPLSVIGFALVDFLVGSTILAGLIIWFNLGVRTNLLFFPIAVAGTVFCALGVSVLLSALTIKYRDFRFVVPFAVQLWFFLSPVIYPAAKLPAKVQMVLSFNPMAGWIELFRYSLLGGSCDFGKITISAFLSIVIAISGVAYFRQVEDSFADII